MFFFNLLKSVTRDQRSNRRSKSFKSVAKKPEAKLQKSATRDQRSNRRSNQWLKNTYKAKLQKSVTRDQMSNMRSNLRLKKPKRSFKLLLKIKIDTEIVNNIVF